MLFANNKACEVSVSKSNEVTDWRKYNVLEVNENNVIKLCKLDGLFSILFTNYIALFPRKPNSHVKPNTHIFIK